MASRPCVGLFDSGVGGLTVLRAIAAQRPDLDCAYFADTAHVPYGPRSRAEIVWFASHITAFLIDQGADFIVMGCNMSSALALDEVRTQVSVPVMGVIAPGAAAAAAATRNGRIAVLATAGTVRSHAYRDSLLRTGRPGIEVFEQACPEFVPLIEAEQESTPEARRITAETLAPVRDFGPDVCILGCTHYPLMRAAITAALGPQVNLLDPADATAAELACRLPHSGNGHTPDSPQRVYYASGESRQVVSWVTRVLDVEAPDVRPAPVFEIEPLTEVRR